jgi:hypothetical protein
VVILTVITLDYSLKNSPKVGSFCDNNALTSLEGGPVYVGGTFYSDNNKLETLEEVRKSCWFSTVITTS